MTWWPGWFVCGLCPCFLERGGLEIGVSWSPYMASFIGFLQADSLTLGDACHLLLLNLLAGFVSLIFSSCYLSAMLLL